MRTAAAADLFLVKIGRFDPDKRWIQAVSAAAILKRSGLRVRMLVRGGREPHGSEVLSTAVQQGLVVEDAPSPPQLEGLTSLLADSQGADVVNLVTFVPEPMLGPIYGSADAVLANSGHEPFGLVGLEVMASQGIPVCGSTGEDYARPFENAIVCDTDDPHELAAYLLQLFKDSSLAARIHKRAAKTAQHYTWRAVFELLNTKLAYLETL
jgi:glycosyltransferase involved in cell wall biosynthesis